MPKKSESRTCPTCDREMHASITRMSFPRDERVYVISDIPCQVCEWCGQTVFDGQTLDQLEKYKSGSIRPEKVVEAWVYRFQEASQFQKVRSTND